MRHSSFLYSIAFIILLVGISFLHQKIPQWKSAAVLLFEKVEEREQIDLEQWQSIENEIEALPSVFPISLIKDSAQEIALILEAIKNIENSINKNFEQKTIKTDQIFFVFSQLRRIDNSFQEIEDNINAIPGFLLSEKEERKRDWLLSKVQLAHEKIGDIKKLEKVFSRLVASESRILLLLQNQNEPRPTGGFVGSVLIADLSAQDIRWNIEDIYALNRRVSEEDKLQAPKFFHDLSKTISLHDANFWPDFPTSAKQYIRFFSLIDEKEPDVIVALNLNVIKKLVKIGGPVTLGNWGITLDEYNFDLGLSFLIESKISGRFAVKKPLDDFTRALFSTGTLKNISYSQLKDFNTTDLIKRKNILAYARSNSLQDLFDKWGIAGRVQFNRNADNFLFFDFVSVGANKSEKFMWTKFWHNSEIQKNGTVKNTLEIVRTHALRPDEIEASLKINDLPLNTQKMLSEDILWKLGEGQNRTVLRVSVPKDAKIISHLSPSGPVEISFARGNEYKIFEIPMFVSPEERVKIALEYETTLSRGSHNWRPYFLHVLGAYGKNQTSFLETISTEPGGEFSAKTDNIGSPQELVDSEFRTVVEF